MTHKKLPCQEDRNGAQKKIIKAQVPGMTLKRSGIMTAYYKKRYTIFWTCLFSVPMLMITFYWYNMLSAEVIDAFQETDREAVSITRIKQGDGTSGIEAIFRVDAQPEQVYRVLKDARFFPEFMPDTQKVEIIGSGENFHIASFAGSIGPFNADITLKRVFNDGTHRIVWSLVEGRPRSVTRFWQVEPVSQGRSSIVTYSNSMDLGLLVPPVLVMRSMEKNIAQMTESIRKRAESRGTWKSREYVKKIEQ